MKLHCRELIAGYKCPRSVMLRDESLACFGGGKNPEESSARTILERQGKGRELTGNFGKCSGNVLQRYLPEKRGARRSRNAASPSRPSGPRVTSR